MSNDWFFEKFALIADAPGAVERMRALVLSLAISGVLVEQREGDGHADELLADIIQEKIQRSKNLQTTDISTSASDNEQVFKIPNRWCWTQLGKIAIRIQYGFTASADPSISEIRMLRITDIQNNRVDWSLVPGCQIEEGEATKYLLIPDDILIARTGGTIGKSFIVPDAPVKAIFASYLIRITPPREILADYLKRFLESPFYWMQLRQMSAGTGQPNVNGQSLGRLSIPLPPLAEQKRIVAKVEELMGICDALEAQQQERESRKSVLVRASLSRFAESPTPENLGYLFHKSYDIPPSELRKSILTLAVQGKLVPQDPNDEPAAEIKMQIARQMSGMRNQRYHTFAAIEEQTDPPFLVPQNWEWMPFGSLGEFLGGGTPSKDNPAYWNGEIPWVSPKDMKRSHIKDSIDHVTPLGADASSGCLIPTGALLMVVRGMILAHTFPVAITQREVTINQDMKALRLAVPEIGEYLLRCFTALTIAMLSNVERSSHGTCRIPTEALSSFLVPIPPLAEQNRIVTKVDQLMALVDELERQQEVSRENASKLLDAIVQEMTNGGRGIAATLES